MSDYKDWDFAVGLGHNSPHIRCRKDPTGLFPDGLKMRFGESAEGHLTVDLLNRASGRTWKASQHNRSLWTNGGTNASFAELGLKPFGAVSPIRVESIVGGLRLYLPDSRPAVMLRGRFKPTAEAAGPEATPAAEGVEAEPDIGAVAAPTPPSAVSPVDVAAPVERVQPKPRISLEEAVQAVNAWKTLMADKLELRLNSGGRLVATAQYGEE